MRERKRPGIRPYFLFMAVYILAALLLITILMVKLWGFAKDYEASRPVNTMNALVQELNQQGWNEDMARAVAEMPHEVQSDEDCVQAVREMLSQGITYARTASGGSTDRINYALRCGDKVIGRVTLVEDGTEEQRSKGDMLPWVVQSLAFDFTGLYSTVEVTVPSNFTVKLNGAALGSEYITGEEIHFSLLEDFYASYAKLPVLVTYRYEHLLGQMEPEVLDTAGKPFQIDDSLGEEQFLNSCSEAELAKLSDFTLRFAERYQYYNAGIGDDPATVYANRLAGYILAGSDLEFRMKAAQEGLTYTHVDSISFEYTTLNQAVSFGGGVYLCDFSSAFTTKGVNGTQEFENNIRMVVIDKNGDMSDLRVAEMSMYKIDSDSEESQ